MNISVDMEKYYMYDILHEYVRYSELSFTSILVFWMNWDYYTIACLALGYTLYNIFEELQDEADIDPKFSFVFLKKEKYFK